MKDSKNILQFLRFSAPYPGNFIQSLLRLEQTAKNAGVETVYVFCTDTSKLAWMQEFMKGRNVYFLTGSYLKDVLLVKKILSQHQIRYVHAHFTTAKQNSLFKVAKALYAGKLFFIMHLHNHHPNKGFLHETIKQLITHIDFYIGCGESVAGEFEKTHKLAKGKVTFVANAIEFNRLEEITKLNRSDFQIGANTKIFLMFGFDYLRKGVDLVMDAMHNLVEKNYDVCLLIGLSRNKDKLLEKVAERFQEVPSWLKIVEARQDVGTYFRFSDCFISASREEGLCTSLIEAVYCECPIISSDIPGHLLNIPHTYIFPLENVAELQNEMETVIALTDAEKKQIAFDQKAYVTKTFDLDHWASKIFAIYQGLN